MATPSVSINVHWTCCPIIVLEIVDEDLHRHAAENLARPIALLFGR